jgi:hypothetical protein
MAAVDQKLKTIRDLATRTATIHLGPRRSSTVPPDDRALRKDPKNRFGLLPLLAKISGTDTGDKRSPLVFVKDQNRAFATVLGVVDANPTADPRHLYTAATVCADPTPAPRRASEVRLSHSADTSARRNGPSQSSNTALLAKASSVTIAA